jgi:hypothetical protein
MTDRHWQNLLGCRSIYAWYVVEITGFKVVTKEVRHMWLPFEIV